VENAGRSQIAEGFARILAPPGAEVSSAGSQPAAALNPLAVEAMWEKGIDISRQNPKSLEALPPGTFDVFVGMGCGDACLATRAKQVITWEIPNPKGQPIEEVRKIRDMIEEKIRALFNEKGGLTE